MNFNHKFKPGDIICSDRFRNALCMIVKSFEINESINANQLGNRYGCDDLIKEDQRWFAYENDYIRPYNWRIATDEDIVNYLARYVEIPLGKVGKHYIAKLTDDGVVLEDAMFTDSNIYLQADELADLKRIIDERLG